MPEGTPVSLYTLSNHKGAQIQITNYGGIIVSIKVPDKAGKIEDVTLGFDSLEGYLSETYLKENPYFGAIIGRYANRIAKGRFSLEGHTYKLAQNNGENHLHGGRRGFDKVVWQAQTFQREQEAGLVLQYTSPDGEEGYPGALSVTVVYTFNSENELKMEYKASTTKTTVLNLTNHAYFNLTGNKRDILEHRLMIQADAFVETDQASIPTGKLQEVAGTPFDFRETATIGKSIQEEHQQLLWGIGYDHTWVLGKKGDMKLAARLEDPQSGRTLEVLTTEPGVQLYTGNYLNGKLQGKGGVAYAHRWGLCLETQHYPDSPNQPHFPSTILKPGEVYESATVYKFSV